MKKHRLLRAAWVAIAVIGVLLCGLSVLNVMASSHLVVPIVYRDLPRIDRPDSTFQPTRDQYKWVCEVVRALDHRYAQLVLMQTLYMGVASVLAIVSYAALRSESKKVSIAQPPDAMDSR
jgi:hypothetical protein